MVQNICIQMVRQAMLLPFAYQTPLLSGIQMNLVLGVWYSDGYCLSLREVFGLRWAVTSTRFNLFAPIHPLLHRQFFFFKFGILFIQILFFYQNKTV